MHGITSKDKIAFAGLTPWHYAETGADGRAVNVGSKALSAREMFQRAELLWNVDKVPAQVILDGKAQPIPTKFGLVRSDTGEAFRHVVGSKYTPLQNGTVADFCDSLRKADESLSCHTAGSLDNGARVWALMRVGADVIIDRNGQADVRKPYLLVRNTHDGRSKLLVAEVLERVVCANTERVALDGALTCTTIVHTASAEQRLREAAAAVGYADTRFAQYAEDLQRLADTPLTRGEFKSFVCDILTDSSSGEGVEKVRKLASDAKNDSSLARRLDALSTTGEMLLHLFENGAGNLGRDAHDAHAAITDWIDHRHGNLERWRKQGGQLGILQRRMDQCLMGDGAKVKARAKEMLLRR